MNWTFEIPEKHYAGYIFDCDGTLADSMPIHYQSWLFAVRRQVPGLEWPMDLFYSMAGLNVHETVNRLNEHFNTAIDWKKAELDKLAHFETVSHRIRPIMPVLEFARSLAQKGIPRSVGTGAHRADARQTLRAIGADSLFEIIVTHEDVSRGKPDPEIFLKAAELMNAEPERCLVLEDGEPGIRAARSAGMDVVRIPHKR